MSDDLSTLKSMMRDHPVYITHLFRQARFMNEVWVVFEINKKKGWTEKIVYQGNDFNAAMKCVVPGSALDEKEF